jgi:hypothetical protein
MPTETLLPDGITGVFKDLWTRTGGSTKWGVLTDASDATYLSHGVVNERQNLNMASPVVLAGAVGSINSLTCTYRAKEDTTIELMVGFATQAGVNCEAAAQALTSSFAVYTSPAVGDPANACGTWTYANVLTADFTFRASTMAGTGYVSDLYCTFDYVLVATGGFGFLMSSCLPPLLAAMGQGLASHGLSFSEIYTILKRAKNNVLPSNMDDFLYLRELLQVRPRYAF